MRLHQLPFNTSSLTTTRVDLRCNDESITDYESNAQPSELS
jgi:hypothetical protein